ncbi:MAG TPA: DUF4184 family protein [Candidatus Bathyarchaeia archaeon]|nr:DUF4184 family protein [Candidatus Bathyarchaeia archaeon]
MPFTPFHLGPASILALTLLSYVYLPALLLGSIAPDIEPMIILYFNLPYPLHGFLHTLIGGTLLALLLTTLTFILRKPIENIMSLLKLSQKQSFQRILAGALIGIYSHILLDAYLYTDIQPFYPLDQNPLLNPSTFRYFEIYTICTISFIIAVAMYGLYLWKKHNPPSQTKN